MVQKCLWSRGTDLPWPLRQCQGFLPLVDAVLEFPTPDSKAYLQCFLGMINYYHRFMPQLAEKLYSLHEATRVKGQTITRTPDCETALTAAKSPLASTTLLHHPDPMAMTNIMVDASDKAVGGQLEQFLSRYWWPIAFFSCKRSKAERKYSIFDRELLALFSPSNISVISWRVGHSPSPWITNC